MNLISNEWRKYFHRFGISILIPALQLITIIGYYVIIRLAIDKRFYDEEAIYQLSTTFVTQFVIFLGLIYASVTLTQELTSGTIKFLLTRPYSRNKLLSAKLAANTILMTVFALCSNVLNFIVQFIIFGTAPDVKSSLIAIGFSVLKVFITTTFLGSLAILISVITNNSAISTALTIIYYISAPAIWAFINVNFLKLSPKNTINNLNPLSINQYFGVLLNNYEQSHNLGEYFWISLIGNLLYAAIFYFIADVIFSRKDISLSD